MQIRTPATLAAILAALPLVTAAQTGFYVGGTLGHRESDIGDDVNAMQTAVETAYNVAYPEGGSPTLAGPLLMSTDVDDADMGFKVFAGWAPHEYTFFEVGYMDLGSNSITLQTDATYDVLPATSETFMTTESTDGFFISAGIKYPMTDRFEVLGHVGGYLYDSSFGASGLVAGVNVSTLGLDDGNSGTSLMFGVGLRYRFTDNLSLRGDWDYLDDINGNEVNLFSLGAEFHFGKN
ncbi:MAG: outer membrane beta-barrel protein [Gammaproteobacteria bacterium]|nr:outer membrane beta-barrel protein [Gammaproteobacteria bacterium]